MTYGDLANFVESTNPWFNRGGGYNDGGIAGQFNFNTNTGEANGDHGFRVVLARLNYKSLLKLRHNIINKKKILYRN